ncbi:MAG: AtpZ/AtpI family protein [Magnetococcales bacterium]|nr:AtpZ/AtpI family protein [Magnetococcales bacterium]
MKETETQAPQKNSGLSGGQLAVRLATEMGSAVLVACGIGYWLDETLDTTPWFIALFSFLGFAAGMLNVYRMANPDKARQFSASADDETSATEKSSDTPKSGTE